MAVTETVLPLVEKYLPKVISPNAHGYIDYSHAAFFLGSAWFLRKKNPRAAAASLTTGAFVLVQSLLTDYALGVKKAIPFEVHGKMDGGFASGSWAIPTLFGFSNTPAARIFQINSVVEATVVGLTDFSSERARAEETA